MRDLSRDCSSEHPRVHQTGRDVLVQVKIAHNDMKLRHFPDVEAECQCLFDPAEKTLLVIHYDSQQSYMLYADFFISRYESTSSYMHRKWAH